VHLVKGQRIWRSTKAGTLSGVVLDCAGDFATIECDDGAVEVVRERDVTAAESVQSVHDRQRA
jgi:hypothetical protein